MELISWGMGPACYGLPRGLQGFDEPFGSECLLHIQHAHGIAMVFHVVEESVDQELSPELPLDNSVAVSNWLLC